MDSIIHTIQQANEPEDIFGELDGTLAEMLATARQIYRKMARAIHPDVSPDSPDAADATKKLNVFWDLAEDKIKQGLYGSGPLVTIQTRKNTYTVSKQIATGDICNVYQCDFDNLRGVFKVSRSPQDNDLVENEAQMLKKLIDADTDNQFFAYFPQVVESIAYRDEGSSARRQANILRVVEDIQSPDELYSLAEVRQHYNNGIDPRDMAWMWRRVLIALGFAHQQGVIHGAVLPPHILIQPQMHGVILVDWCYAIHTGQRIRAIAADYDAWYPREVFKKEDAVPSLDIYMAARCMVDVVDNMPARMSKYFEWCMMENARMRPQDAWKLLEEFDEMLEALWGPRRFRKFEMPEKGKR